MAEKKNNNKLIALIVGIVGVVVIGIVALCVIFMGGGDVLKGRWEGETNDGMAAVWNFDGRGKCDLTTDILDEAPGTYTIDGTEVTIELEIWSDASVYDFELEGDSLQLNAQSMFGADFTLTRK